MTATYGYQHQKLRTELKVTVEAGLATCWRCQEPIEPDDDWHLGHDDDDRSVWRGPEHAMCNLSAAGTKRQYGQRRRISQRPRRAMVSRQRECEVCGTDYKASYREQRTCSRSCGVELRRRDHTPTKPKPKPPPVMHDRTCSECGAAFTTRWVNKLTCGDTCSYARTVWKMREHYRTNETYRLASIERAKASQFARRHPDLFEIGH